MMCLKLSKCAFVLFLLNESHFLSFSLEHALTLHDNCGSSDLKNGLHDSKKRCELSASSILSREFKGI